MLSNPNNIIDGRWATTVAETLPGNRDTTGEEIVRVFSYNPPNYAIYRTASRLLVQYADTDTLAGRQLSAQQHARLSPLAPVRGQINGLIDGWHFAELAELKAKIRADAGGAPEPAEPPKRSMRGRLWDALTLRRARSKADAKRALYYDRRVADALVILLDDPDTLAMSQELLIGVKNDIITERTSMSRLRYLASALGLVLVVISVMAMLATGWFDRLHSFPAEAVPVWTAVSGGALGALFSIALGLKNRALTIDLQKRENQIDVILRILIGSMAGGILYCLLARGIVTTTLVPREQLMPGGARCRGKVGSCPQGYSEITVFLIGLVAGFLERLVPDLLAKTNFATPEPQSKVTPMISVTAAPKQADLSTDAQDDDAANEPCLCDGPPRAGEAATEDRDLPAAAGGVSDPETPAKDDKS